MRTFVNLGRSKFELSWVMKSSASEKGLSFNNLQEMNFLQIRIIKKFIAKVYKNEINTMSIIFA